MTPLTPFLVVVNVLTRCRYCCRNSWTRVPVFSWDCSTRLVFLEVDLRVSLLPYSDVIPRLSRRRTISSAHSPRSVCSSLYTSRIHYSARDRAAEYCDERDCLSLSVSLSVRVHIFGTTRPVFTKFFACYLQPWLGPTLAA